MINNSIRMIIHNYMVNIFYCDSIPLTKDNVTHTWSVPEDVQYHTVWYNPPSICKLQAANEWEGKSLGPCGMQAAIVYALATFLSHASNVHHRCPTSSLCSILPCPRPARSPSFVNASLARLSRALTRFRSPLSTHTYVTLARRLNSREDPRGGTHHFDINVVHECKGIEQWIGTIFEIANDILKTAKQIKVIATT